MKLDSKGRCCGKKPIFYKRSHGDTPGPFYFCVRCSRAFDTDGNQIENWGWKLSWNPEKHWIGPKGQWA